jgi:hypothetical protein
MFSPKQETVELGNALEIVLKLSYPELGRREAALH